MRSNGPVATKELAMTCREWPGGLVAWWPATDIKKIFIYRSGRQHWPFLQTGRKWPFGPPHEPPHPAAIAEEARTVRLDAVLEPSRRSVPVGDSSTPESRTLLYSGGGGQALTGFSIRAVVVKRFQANNSNFCRSRARASLRDQPLALPAWDQQEETEQSDSRTDRGRAIDTRVQSELVSSIVPRGTSLRWIVAPTCSSLRLSAPFPLSSGTRFHHSTCDA
jgi:hypothetical protein